MTFDIEFSVIDTPRTQGSKRMVGHGHFIEEHHDELMSWREAVKTACRVVLPDEHTPIDLPLVVYATFYLRRPMAHYIADKPFKGLKNVVPAFVAKTPDLDKLLRGLLDALTASGVWVDDSRVVRIVASKRYCVPEVFEMPGARVRVTEVTE